MAAELTITADSYQEYWVDVLVNGIPLSVQIDTGMTQAACEVGLGLTPAEFERLAPTLSQVSPVEHHIAGNPLPTPIATGIRQVSIIGLDGSEIETRIARIDANLLGVCFFHRQHDFELHWDLASRTMTLRMR